MFGMSGHLRVLSDLLRRGYNAAIPLVDTGDDAVVIDDASHRLHRLQVKSGTPARYLETSVAVDFQLGRKQLGDDNGAALHYMFMAWIWDAWVWVLIPRADLKTLKDEAEMRAAEAGRIRKHDRHARSDGLKLTIRFSRDASGVRDAVLWGESISVYLQRWPPAWPDRPPASSSG